MKKYILNIFLITFIFIVEAYSNTNSDKLYEKIDLFGEVLDKIKQEYVDEIDQADVMDSAINGVLQSLDPTLLTCRLNFLKVCKQILKESLEV